MFLLQNSLFPERACEQNIILGVFLDANHSETGILENSIIAL